MAVPAFNRRRALSGAATVGLSLPLLTACGSDDDAAADTPPSSDSSPAPDGDPAEPIASTADVPIGGGLIVTDSEVVITQPTEGDFVAFTAVCTHKRCIVSEVTTTINCACHGSTYDIATGEVTGGPAPAPLAAVPITVDGDQVVLA